MFIQGKDALTDIRFWNLFKIFGTITQAKILRATVDKVTDITAKFCPESYVYLYIQVSKLQVGYGVVIYESTPLGKEAAIKASQTMCDVVVSHVLYSSLLLYSKESFTYVMNGKITC